MTIIQIASSYFLERLTNQLVVAALIIYLHIHISVCLFIGVFCISTMHSQTGRTEYYTRTIPNSRRMELVAIGSGPAV